MPTIPLRKLFSLAFALVITAMSAKAANDTWNGASSTSGSWSDTANWGGATIASGDSLFFGGTARLANSNNLSSFSFSGVTFNSGAGVFKLSGNSFDLTGGITNNSTSGQTISNNINLSAGTHVIYAPASTANITNSGNIGENGSGAAALVFSTPGSKTLVLNGSNSFSGGLTLAGTSTTKFGVILGNTNALGTNWILINNGALDFTAAAPGANPFVMGNTITNYRDLYFHGSNVMVTGPVVWNAQKQLSVDNGQTVTLNGGVINGAGQFVMKSGPGTLVLNSALSGGSANATENGVSWANTSFFLKNTSGVGTLVLGDPAALGDGSKYFIIDGGGGVIMADTNLSGGNALAVNLVLSAANGGPGLTVGGANNIVFSGSLYNSIGNAGAVTRYLIVTNTAATVFSGPSLYLSDGASPGTLSVNVAGTSGGVLISSSIGDGNQPGGNLIKTNAGILKLSGANSYSGSTTVSAGQLWVNAAGASPSSTFVINSASGLVFSNDTSFTLGGLSGSGDVSLTNDLGSSVSLTVGNNNASTVYSGGLTGAGTLTKNGSGTLTLSGTNSQTGLTTVSQGALVISPNFIGHGNLTVSDGATLGVMGNSATTSAQIGTLQIGSSTLQFSSLPAPTKALITVNTFSPVYAGSGLINVSVTAALNVGTYNLIAYTNFSGTISDFAAPTLPTGTVGYLVNNTAITPNAIQLVITSSAQYLWTGATDTNWDFGTLNWSFNGSTSAYADGGPVRFDDTATRTTVNLASSVQPFSILVTNSSKNYTFSSEFGYYIYGSSTLAKKGPGILTLRNLNNQFTGDVSIDGGAVALESSTLGGGNVTLNSGTLVLSNSALGNLGSVTLNGGSLVLSGNTTLTNNTITDNAGIVSSNGAQVITGNIIGSGTLTQNGNGTLTLSGIGNSFAGGTAIQGGTVVANAITGLGTGIVTLGDGVSANNATLTFGAGGTVANNLVVAAGGTGTYSILGNNSFSGSVTLNNGLTISNSVFLTGPVSGAGTLTIAGGGGCRITSTGNTGFTGGILISNGATFKAVNGALDTNNVVAVDTNSIFDTIAQPNTIAGLNDGPSGGGSVAVAGQVLTLGGTGNYSFSGQIIYNSSLLKNGSGTQTLLGTNGFTGATTVSNGTLVVSGILTTNSGAVSVGGGTLAGTGTILGPTTVSGGTLSPAGNGVIGTLTISNSLTLQGTLAVDINKTSGTNDVITGLTSVIYGGTLAVNNLSGTLTTSDSFKLFSAGTYAGAFASITPATPASGLAWDTSTLTTDGTLRINTGMANNPTNITCSVSGGQIVLSWPADHTGWYLQVQTNTLSSGLGTNWVTVPNSSSANSYTNTVDPSNGSVFYRLKNQP